MKHVTVSEHIWTEGTHLDIFFETEDSAVLVTYSCGIEQKDNLLSGKKTIISRKKDHRALYLDYSGPISGNRGHIQIIWQGQYNDEKFIFADRLSVKLVLKNMHYLKE